MATREGSIPGTDRPVNATPGNHPVLGTPIDGPWADPHEILYVGMGCFWGVERIFWNVDGVIATAAGYMGGTTKNPTYREVCTGATGHAEVVRVVYDPTQVSAAQLMKVFWENHDPTQADRQGNDIGGQYRSCVFCTTDGQLQAAQKTRDAFQKVLADAGHGQITTEITTSTEAGPFYLAEGSHQAYLHHVPGGYCNHGPNGMTCPIGII
ncbi:peptide-methionine (S)-S-oxide reductase MsrA [Gleimia hominis]|uniref:Peptide methionine sulfoxide reductase MsrA n=1 Tax=Gleimia hominis TaxID=595468 RepID=A0ABU3IBU1_9ACTO|nr:peptide-methionine (S)-S-oxide reductase MsrA [Gleimia hominis]MDT3767844.1 peptide-methionine (S)-S-oxide reductase MsrA [Gleimia hominis]